MRLWKDILKTKVWHLLTSKEIVSLFSHRLGFYKDWLFLQDNNLIPFKIISHPAPNGKYYSKLPLKNMKYTQGKRRYMSPAFLSIKAARKYNL